jgi:hypothetical protein
LKCQVTMLKWMMKHHWISRCHSAAAGDNGNRYNGGCILADLMLYSSVSVALLRLPCSPMSAIHMFDSGIIESSDIMIDSE